MAADLETVIDEMRSDLAESYPKAVLLFGSAARYRTGLQKTPPEDIDLLYIGSIQPFGKKVYAIQHDFFFFQPHQIVGIAKSLRYQPKALSRAKMYMQDTWKGIVQSDIAACLLLGPDYQQYGFLQMETEQHHRDYSIHQVLIGKKWWQALQAYARDHRGLKGLLVDKALGLDRFQAP